MKICMCNAGPRESSGTYNPNPFPSYTYLNITNEQLEKLGKIIANELISRENQREASKGEDWVKTCGGCTFCLVILNGIYGCRNSECPCHKPSSGLRNSPDTAPTVANTLKYPGPKYIEEIQTISHFKSLLREKIEKLQVKALNYTPLESKAYLEAIDEILSLLDDTE